MVFPSKSEKMRKKRVPFIMKGESLINYLKKRGHGGEVKGRRPSAKRLP